MIITARQHAAVRRRRLVVGISLSIWCLALLGSPGELKLGNEVEASDKTKDDKKVVPSSPRDMSVDAPRQRPPHHSNSPGNGSNSEEAIVTLNDAIRSMSISPGPVRLRRTVPLRSIPTAHDAAKTPGRLWEEVSASKSSNLTNVATTGVRYQVVDARGLAFRSNPDVKSRVDRKVARRRGVTWLTKGTVIEGGPPVDGWVHCVNGYWLPLWLQGTPQLKEFSTPRDRSPSTTVPLPTSAPTKPPSESLGLVSALQRVKDSAIARWRSRFGGQGEAPPARTVWVRRTPFGMSVRKGGIDVLGVTPGSSAQAQGVRRGDRLVAVGGELVDKSNWRAKFLALRPPFTIMIESPPSRHPSLASLRAPSPGIARLRPRTARIISQEEQLRIIQQSSLAARPLGLRSAILPLSSTDTEVSNSTEEEEKKDKDTEEGEEALELQFGKDVIKKKVWKHQQESDEIEPHLDSSNMSKEVRGAISRLSNALADAPNASVETQDPTGLQVTLLPHQRQALAWMSWREKQVPSGGVLADEMGLGKTMMMISLIVHTLPRNPSQIGQMTAQQRLRELDKALTQFYASYNSTMLNSPDLITKAASHYSKPENGRGEALLNGRLYKAYGYDLRSLRRPTLVVCPAILIHQWLEEIAQRTDTGLIDAYAYYGPQRTKDPKDLGCRDVVLTTYETLVRDVLGPFPPNSTKSPLLSITWDRVILDEAHMIKNPLSRRAKAVRALPSRTRWAVTGTPLQNEMGELFSLMRFLEYAPFNHSQVWDVWVRNSTERASTLLRAIMLRRTKTMKGLDGKPLVRLPPRTFTLHRLNLSTTEFAVHNALGNRSRALFKQYIRERKLGPTGQADTEGRVSYISFLSSLLRMRQACCHPALLKAALDPATVAMALGTLKVTDEGHDAKSHDVDVYSLTAESGVREMTEKSWESSKIKFTLELLEKVRTTRPGDKTVVVSQWTSLLSVLEYHLEKMGWKYCVIDGNVPSHHRKDIISVFNKDPKAAQVMLLSMGAGGVGLNLKGANHLILLDIHWNPAMEAQVCDRIYRVGQQKPVFVHKLLCRGTIEDRVQQLQDRKRRLFNEVVPDPEAERGGGSNSEANKLTLEEMQMLFS